MARTTGSHTRGCVVVDERVNTIALEKCHLRTNDERPASNAGELLVINWETELHDRSTPVDVSGLTSASEDWGGASHLRV